MTKKEYLKISYVLNAVLVLMVFITMFTEISIPRAIWVPILIIAVINSLIGGWMFIDLIGKKE